MLELDDNYFKEEERCGFKIPSMMKRAWAVEMELTCELLNICSQYGLRIYASWGTLLGAVRHKGFIPWDDDMDFDMPREDYMKLMDILKHKDIYTDFYVSSLYTEGTHCQPSATIMNYYKIPLPSEIQNKFYNFRMLQVLILILWIMFQEIKNLLKHSYLFMELYMMLHKGMKS